MADDAQSIEERKRGRPTWYNPAINETAYKLAMLSQTNEEMAETLGIPLSTFTRWMAKHRHFREAIARGRAGADADMAISLHKRGMGYEYEAVKIFGPAGDRTEPVYAKYMEHVPPETAAASLWLRNRQPRHWREKTDINLTAQISLEAWVFDGLGAKQAVIDTTAKPIEDKRDKPEDG